MEADACRTARDDFDAESCGNERIQGELLYGDRLLPHGVSTTQDDVWYLKGRKSNINDILAEPVIAGPVIRKSGHAKGRCCADTLEPTTTTFSSRTIDTTLP